MTDMMKVAQIPMNGASDPAYISDSLGGVAAIANPLGTFTYNRGGLGELLQSITHE